MNTMTKLTKETFAELQWEDTIAKCANHESLDYCSAFSAQARKATESGNSEAQEAFALLAKATFVALRTGSNDEPFMHEWLQNFTEDQLELFKQLAQSAVDAEMRARLADIVWERRRDPNMGRLAVDSYLKAARVLERENQFSDSFDRLERTTNLARRLGKKSKHFEHAIRNVEAVLSRYGGDDASFFSAQLMELLQDHGQGDNLKYASFAEIAATRAIAETEWDRARRYLFIEAEWYFRADEPEKGTGTRLRMLELHVQEADAIVNTSNSSVRHNQACHHIERAIQGYQDIGGSSTKQRRNELYLLLREYQKKAQGELGSFPINFAEEETKDLSDALTTQIVEMVKGKSVAEALRTLASLPLLQDAAHMREPAERFVRTSPVALLLPLVMHSSDGRVSGRPPLKPATQEEQVEAEIQAHMFKNSNDCRIWRVRNLLLPAIEQIKADHRIRMDDLKQIVVDNPVIPVGREFLFAKGLHAGLMDDYLVAAHLLIPQIENSIRHVLSLHGAITSGLSRQKIQNHYDLNVMLNNDLLEKKLMSVLSENLVFELKGLLVQHFGANLRNEIAHGTLGVNEFNSGFYGLQLIYLWWLALRLCFTNVLPAQEPA